jgi:hypothetical protein
MISKAKHCDWLVTVDFIDSGVSAVTATKLQQNKTKPYFFQNEKSHSVMVW